MFGADGMLRVRRPKGKRLDYRYCRKTVKFGGGHIMVWGAFSYNGMGPLHLIEGNMDGLMYKTILNDTMLPYAEWNMPLKWTFQQDNDPKHTSRVAKAWFSEKMVNVMEWPAQSPDLNPIENLWEIVDRRINRSDVRNRTELFSAVKLAWEAIPDTIVKNLIDSMPRRCKAVLSSNGFPTKY
jgi:hypothetical protein